MPHIARFNRFPSGNLGGIVARSNEAAPEKASIALFMQPLKQQEILLNIPGLPKKATIDTGEMRTVLALDGNGAASRWRLYVAQRDSLGVNVWSPLTFANVWSDGRICWGHGNLVPSTFAGAWTDFWTAPFNKDLAADVRVLGYSEWLEDHRDSVQEAMMSRGMRAAIERVNRRLSESDQSSVQYFRSWSADNKIDETLMRLRCAKVAFNGARAEIRRRGEIACADRGVTWVAINHKAYMRALSKCGELDAKIKALVDKRDLIEGACIRMSDAISQWARYYAGRIFHKSRPGVRTDGHGRARFNDSAKQDRDWYFGQYKAPAEIFFKFFPINRARVVRSMLYRALARALHDRVSQSLEQEMQTAYNEWVQDAVAEGLSGHFLHGKWTSTLSFRDMMKEVRARWGEVRAFPPCDGIFSIPYLCAENTDLPPWQETLTVYDTTGCAYQGIVDSRFGFFRKVSEKVKFVFYPGDDRMYLTNGRSIIGITDETFTPTLIELENEDVEGFDPVRWLSDKGIRLSRIASLDMSR